MKNLVKYNNCISGLNFRDFGQNVDMEYQKYIFSSLSYRIQRDTRRRYLLLLSGCPNEEFLE